MGNQSTKDYKFAEKNKWRLWWWKQNAMRLDQKGVKRSHAVGLYLAAEADKDRDIACRKFGFRPENLIAVEKEPATVKKLRAKRVVVIEGDILETLEHSPANSFDFISLDMCNCLSKTFLTSMIKAMVNGALKHSSPFLINVLGARDRDVLKVYKDGIELGKNQIMHRGGIFLEWYLHTCLLMEEKGRGQPLYQNFYREEMYRRCIRGASLYDYKSYPNNQPMHSVAFTSLPTPGNLSEKHTSILFPLKTKSKIKNRVTNAKAIRTQRINGTKAPSPIK